MTTIKIGELRDKKLTEIVNQAGVVEVQHYNDTAFFLISAKKLEQLQKAKKAK